MPTNRHGKVRHLQKAFTATTSQYTTDRKEAGRVAIPPPLIEVGVSWPKREMNNQPLQVTINQLSKVSLSLHQLNNISLGLSADRTGPPGETGAGLLVKGTFNNTGELPTDAVTGDAYLIDGDLYVWSQTEWINTGNVQGPQGEQGIPGETGPQGEEGYTPVKGTDYFDGDIGPQGIQGETGPQGETGLTGAEGPQGEQGIQGETGPAGADGLQGEPGIDGQQGETGPQGPDGYTPVKDVDYFDGEQGLQGLKGDTGDTGPQGIQGEIGLTGLTGPAGEQGMQGLQGIQGETGLQGSHGETGPQGATGLQGDTGPQGETGPKGDTGETGSQGPKGETGPEGPMGEFGNEGPEGPQGHDGYTPIKDYDYFDGIDGKSAHETWLDLGNSGDEHDFIEWVRGKSAHETWVDLGNFGLYGGTSEHDFIEGIRGKSAYEIWLDLGHFSAGISEQDFIEWVKGKSAYETWVDLGNSSPGGSISEQDFIDSLKGEQGVQGLKGDTGDAGIQGTQGETGPEGPKGDTGPQGIQGPQGETGLAGTTGPAGEQGMQGLQGETGLQGIHGIQGLVGPEGPRGFQGDQGIQGGQGIEGEIGQEGPQGPVGPVGPEGPEGPQGIKGDPGGATAAGTNSSVQFNDNGAIAGATSVFVHDEELCLEHNPVTTLPPADSVKLFARKIAGRSMPAYIGPSGLDSALQPLIARNKVGWFNPPGNVNTVHQLGMVVAATGTATAANVATVNIHQAMRRLEYAVTTAAATAVAGARTTVLQQHLGAVSTPFGGFTWIARFGPSRGVASNATRRFFAGMTSITAAPTDVNPSTWATNGIGVGADSTDVNFHIMHRAGTGTMTKVDTGIPKAYADNTEMFEVAIFTAPTAAGVGVQFTRLSDGERFIHTIHTNLPAETQLLTWQIWNSAGGTSSVIGLAVASIYIETDY